ncbi:upstream activation factor subunit spp27-like [Impatiens glandulifera]|uniref:upstream activation factor subunit spp27-like n=1 Tax=Impatiens glandulifera TaxID=253017 RepID=UPI001FB0FCF9|nr:upstream activation factor subunit spp27-like [Impatiens glandulifera]
MATGNVFGKLFGPLMAAAKSSASQTAVAKSSSSETAVSATKTAPRLVGILKPVKVSPALANFLGVTEASRTDAVRKIWQHIKQNNLQNPENKKEIFCDEKLKTIFEEKDKVGFLEIAKLLKQHFVKS